MKYKLIDINDNEYTINDGITIPSTVRGSLSRQGEVFTFNQDIINRSFLPGSVVVGSSRVESKKFQLRADFALTDDESYDDYLNELLLQLENSIILRDITNEKQCSITVLSVNVDYDPGSIKRSGSYNISLNLLDGFWTDVNPVEVVRDLSAGTTNIPLTNGGYLKTYAKLDVMVLGLAPQLDFYIDSTKEGLQLIDNTLGQATLDNLIIDNKAGTLTIADFDRTQSIVPKSGYFPIPIGDSELVIETPDVGMDITITYFQRYFV